MSNELEADVQAPVLTSSEIELVLQGLSLLKAQKVEAHRCVQHAPRVVLRFTEADFGIPKITALIERLGGLGDLGDLDV